MNEITVVDPRVAEFAALVHQGIEAWQRAGKILCQLVEEDPDVRRAILAENDHLTDEILNTFLRMGRRELYPYLAMDDSPGARRLALLPYDQQVQLHRAIVPVVVWRGGATQTVEKRVSSLTKQEAGRAFNQSGLRPANEQMRLLRSTAARGHVGHGMLARDFREPKVAEEEPAEANAAPSAPVVVADLSEDPKVELRRLLNTAHDAMIGAREALALIKRQSPHDRHITTALQGIGQLRFALNDGEI